MSSPQEYDAIIIGSGQGGNPLAHRLADRDWKVALVERQHLGGSCINYGCTPTKTMLASAHLAHRARNAAQYGVHTGEVTVDLAQVVQRKNKIVGSMRAGQQKQVDKRPTLDLIRGVGRFVGPDRIEVGGRQFTAEHIFVDTGSSPRVPELPGLARVPYYTNLNIMDLETLPQHLLILGGGYLGLEFGQMFRRFGSRVTIVQRGAQLMSREDEDVARELQGVLEQEGITILLDAQATGVSAAGEEITLTVETGNGPTATLHGSHLLLAAGRVPNTAALNLPAAGVETDDDGYICVDERLKTSATGVWALGDVKGGPAFTNVSYDDHLVILDDLFGDGSRTTEGRIIPYTLFTDPELGRVGLTEKEARDQGYRLKIGTFPASSVARAIETGRTAGMMKVVVDAETDLVLGAAILSDGGGELVQNIATLMRANAPYTIMRRVIYVHPTMTEGFYGLMARVEAVD
ncbi:MAG: mercuric reductase [Chloroflexota bacterium]